MSKKIIILSLIIFLILSNFFANEKEIIKNPEGKLKFSSIFKVEDEKGNVFNLYKNLLTSDLSPSFTYMFTRNQDSTINYTNYLSYSQKFLTYLTSGICYGIGSILCTGFIPIFTSVIYNIGCIAGFATGAGLFFVIMIMGFAMSGYNYQKAKGNLLKMIDEYNTSLNQGAKDNTQIKADLVNFRLGKVN